LPRPREKKKKMKIQGGKEKGGPPKEGKVSGPEREVAHEKRSAPDGEKGDAVPAKKKGGRNLSLGVGEKKIALRTGKGGLLPRKGKKRTLRKDGPLYRKKEKRPF